jgi:hypothetical protein
MCDELDKLRQRVWDLAALHQQAWEQLQTAEREARSVTPIHRLAEKIHRADCRQNHIDGCGWEYESGEDKWQKDAHRAYLQKAKDLSVAVNVNRISIEGIDPHLTGALGCEIVSRVYDARISGKKR